MMREVQKMANTIEKDIQLTMDVPSNHPDGKLPVLDLKMWVESRRDGEGEGGRVDEGEVEHQEIMYQFYEKEMVAPRVIGRESVLPERVKLTTLTQEIIRVKKNTCKPLRKRMEREQMSRFAMKMWLSGYNKRERKDILVAGLKGFKRLEDLEVQGRRSINRSRRENYEARLLAKHGAKSNWYKGRKGDKETLERGGREKEGGGIEKRRK